MKWFLLGFFLMVIVGTAMSNPLIPIARVAFRLAPLAGDFFEAADGFRNLTKTINDYGLVNQQLRDLGLSNGQQITRFTPRDGVPVAPDGWAGPDSPPSSTGICYRSDPSFPYAGCLSTGSVCSAYKTVLDSQRSAYAPHTLLSEFNGGTVYRCSFRDRLSNLMDLYGNMSCPDGYRLSSNTCGLDNPSLVKWPSDNEVTYVRDSSGRWNPHPRDTDTGMDTSDPMFSSATSDSPTITRSGQDSYGNPVTEQITRTPDGGMDYKRFTESTDSQGNPFVQRDWFHNDANGTVTNTSSTIITNTTINNIVNNTTGEETISQAGSQIDTSNLAKEQTLQDVKTRLGDTNNKLDTANNTLNDIRNKLGSGEDGPLPPDQDIPERTVPLSFQYQSTPGQCPPDPSFEALGGTVSFPLSYLCTYAAEYFRPMAIAAALVVAVFIVFV
jgi:hypothetical protein